MSAGEPLVLDRHSSETLEKIYDSPDSHLFEYLTPALLHFSQLPPSQRQHIYCRSKVQTWRHKSSRHVLSPAYERSNFSMALWVGFTPAHLIRCRSAGCKSFHRSRRILSSPSTPCKLLETFDEASGRIRGKYPRHRPAQSATCSIPQCKGGTYRRLCSGM